MAAETSNGIIEALEQSRKLQHYTQTMAQNVHHFYLYGFIEDGIEKYADLLNTLKTAPETDTVILYINSEGGSLRLAVQLINSMLASQARVITALDGQACSAATLVFLAGEEYIINPYCTFMIHNYSGGLWGKGHELQSQLEHYTENTKALLESFYGKIMSEEEIAGVVDGKDIWMTSDELIERIERYSEPEAPVTSSEEVLDRTDDVGYAAEPVKKKKASKKTASKKSSKKKASKKTASKKTSKKKASAK